MNKWSWTISLACSVVIALASGRAEARDIKVRGTFAGTFLSTRIDLNNDGSLAGWGTVTVKSNLGRATSQGVVEIDLVDPPTGACPAGQLELTLVAGRFVDTFTQTAKVKDRFFGEATSSTTCVDPATGALSSNNTITVIGGTGKFAGATGSFENSYTGFVLLADPDPASKQSFGSFAGEFTGTLTLP
jgi:hypothetical protein